MMCIKRFLVILILALIVCSCQSRINKIIDSFGVDLKGIPFSIIDKEEQWYPNGDGKLFAELSFESASTEDIIAIKKQMLNKGAKELPIVNYPFIIWGDISSYCESSSRGLYVLQIDSVDTRNYSLMIYDENKKKAIIRIEIF